ncbi:MAG: hypothetical protein PVH38_03370 [Gammaproteobacteria bacterium]|jgi:hypothetical protein
MMTYRTFFHPAMAALLLALAIPAGAADPGGSSDWAFDVGIYAWTPSMEVTPDDGNSVKMSFSDILDNLDMTFMGVFGARKDKWSLLGDVIYMKLSDTLSGSRKLPNIPETVTGKVDAEMKSWIVTAAGGYNLVDTGSYSLDLLGGARYLSIDVPLKAQVDQFQRKVTPSGDIWSGIIGVRGKADLAEHWYLQYYLDAGAGQKSSNTWQALAGVGYQFQKLDAVLGYRYLTYDIDSGDLEDITIKGPYAGVRFYF